MAYSLEILVVNQKEFTSIPFESQLEIVHENERLGPLRLKKIWPFMSSIQGIWCNLLVKNEILFANTYLFMDIDYDILLEVGMFNVFNKKENHNNYHPFIVKKEYEDDFKKILHYLTEQSPIKTIMVLPLCRNQDTEIIQGPLELDLYIDLIMKKKIPYDVCVIVKNSEITDQ